MQIWGNIFRIVILVIGVMIIVFNVLLYNFYEKQKIEMENIKNQQEVESEFNSNKFKYQQDRMEQVSKDLEDSKLQIKDQKDAVAVQKEAFLQEVEKRQQVENQNKSVQTSLVDIKAESDAIKQDMKSWQKDYVSVLAELEKKIDDSQYQTKNLEKSLVDLNIPELKENIESLKVDIEKITHPPDNNLSGSSGTQKKIEHEHFESQ